MFETKKGQILHFISEDNKTRVKHISKHDTPKDPNKSVSTTNNPVSTLPLHPPHRKSNAPKHTLPIRPRRHHNRRLRLRRRIPPRLQRRQSNLHLRQDQIPAQVPVLRARPRSPRRLLRRRGQIVARGRRRRRGQVPVSAAVEQDIDTDARREKWFRDSRGGDHTERDYHRPGVESRRRLETSRAEFARLRASGVISASGCVEAAQVLRECRDGAAGYTDTRAWMVRNTVSFQGW